MSMISPAVLCRWRVGTWRARPGRQACVSGHAGTLAGDSALDRPASGEPGRVGMARLSVCTLCAAAGGAICAGCVHCPIVACALERRPCAPESRFRIGRIDCGGTRVGRCASGDGVIRLFHARPRAEGDRVHARESGRKGTAFSGGATGAARPFSRSMRPARLGAVSCASVRTYTL